VGLREERHSDSVFDKHEGGLCARHNQGGRHPHKGRRSIAAGRADRKRPVRREAGWKLVKNFDGPALDLAIRQVGWTFFCLAGEIKSTAFGFNIEQVAQRAVARILARPRPKQFNSLAIKEVTSRRFLGVLYVCVHAQSRHIQESLFLFSPARIQNPTRTRSAAVQTQAWDLARAKQSASESANGNAAVATTPSL
jgi:hypothetical protein